MQSIYMMTIGLEPYHANAFPPIRVCVYVFFQLVTGVVFAHTILMPHIMI